MHTDFQLIAEPLIRRVFPFIDRITRSDEGRGAVHLKWLLLDTLVTLAWEPSGPPWMNLKLRDGKLHDVRLPRMEFDPILVSQDMRTEIEVLELLKLLEHKIGGGQSLEVI